MGLSNRLSCETGSFFYNHNPFPHPTDFTARGFESLISCTKTVGFAVCPTPQLFFLAYSSVNVGPSPMRSATLPYPSFSLPPSLPLLPVWMNVSLTPWLPDFHDSLAVLVVLLFYSFSFLRFLFILFRENREGREREREKH